MQEGISCDMCSTQLKDYKEYGIHMREKHNKYYCGVCREEFSNQTKLEDHIKYKHGINPEKSLS